MLKDRGIEDTGRPATGFGRTGTDRVLAESGGERG